MILTDYLQNFGKGWSEILIQHQELLDLVCKEYPDYELNITAVNNYGDRLNIDYEITPENHAFEEDVTIVVIHALYKSQNICEYCGESKKNCKC